MVKQRQKVAEILKNEDSIDVKELKKCPDLNVYREWFIKVIKST